MTNRDTKGRYAKRGTKTILFIAVVVIAFIVGSFFIDNTQTYTNTNSATSTPEVVESSSNPLDEIKARENFKKRVENQAKQVFLGEEIADRKAQIAALEAEIEQLNTELEVTRTDELNFQ